MCAQCLYFLPLEFKENLGKAVSMGTKIQQKKIIATEDKYKTITKKDIDISGCPAFSLDHRITILPGYKSLPNVLIISVKLLNKDGKPFVLTLTSVYKGVYEG